MKRSAWATSRSSIASAPVDLRALTSRGGRKDRLPGRRRALHELAQELRRFVADAAMVGATALEERRVADLAQRAVVVDADDAPRSSGTTTPALRQASSVCGPSWSDAIMSPAGLGSAASQATEIALAVLPALLARGLARHRERQAGAAGEACTRRAKAALRRCDQFSPSMPKKPRSAGSRRPASARPRGVRSPRRRRAPAETAARRSRRARRRSAHRRTRSRAPASGPTHGR